MRLKWYGHAAFRLQSDSGVSVITDPYTPQTSGYAPIPDLADLVVISSDNDSFHCRADLISGSPAVINALALAQGAGEQTLSGITITAIEAMEALNHREHDPDQNGLYRIAIDGLHIGHMGDVGNALSEQQIAFFEGVDVLLALAGGHPTIELDDLQRAIQAIRPKLVVPMHFRTLRYRPRNTYWITAFMQLFDDATIDFACDSEVTLEPATLPAETRALILTHAC